MRCSRRSTRSFEKQREHREADGPDRQIDPEHDRPVHGLDQKRADRRPDDRGKAPHGRHRALDAGPLGRRVDVADDRHRDRLDRAGADALDRAKDDQQLHRAGKPAQRRADQEDRRPDKEHPPAAVYVGEPPVERDRHRHRQKRHREHPAEQVKPAEMADDRRQRGRDDRAFDGRHEDRHQRRHQHQAAARHGDGRTRFLRHRLVQPRRSRHCPKSAAA